MGLKHKVLILHYLRLSGPEGTPMWSPTLKAKQVHSIYSRFFKFMFKGLEKNSTEIPDQQLPGQQLGQLININKRA